MKRIKAAIFMVAVAVGIVGAPSVAAAEPTASPEDCKTIVLNLKDRPDSGNHGTWALDTITRTIKVCHVVEQTALKTEVVINTWKYAATVTDVGTFVTVAGAHNSPNNGHAVVGGVNGAMAGGFHAHFTAPHDWIAWDGDAWNGKTLTGATGAGNPTTSETVKKLWKDGFNGSSIDNDWAWVYQTCVKVLAKKGFVEFWIDNHKTDGEGKQDGDIWGKRCPSPSPSASSSTNPLPTLTAAPPSDSLPITGSNVPLVVGGGAALVLIGGVLFVLARRRGRTVRFQA